MVTITPDLTYVSKSNIRVARGLGEKGSPKASGKGGRFDAVSISS